MQPASAIEKLQEETRRALHFLVAVVLSQAFSSCLQHTDPTIMWVKKTEALKRLKYIYNLHFNAVWTVENGV